MDRAKLQTKPPARTIIYRARINISRGPHLPPGNEISDHAIEISYCSDYRPTVRMQRAMDKSLPHRIYRPEYGSGMRHVKGSREGNALINN